MISYWSYYSPVNNNGNTATTALRDTHREITLALNVARSAPVSYCLLISSHALH